uniref:Uncharacterized protein n=1 Tax=Arundo donax TaxID=35708 RepID=A0A0A8ZQD7_ARUDO
MNRGGDTRQGRRAGPPA